MPYQIIDGDKRAARPQFVFNPDHNALELFGNMESNKNKEHGFLDLNTGEYTAGVSTDIT